MTTSKSIVRRRDCRSDDAEAARSQFSAKLVVPFDHLGAQPRDHHRWLSIRGAEDIVAKLDTAGVCKFQELGGRHWSFDGSHARGSSIWLVRIVTVSRCLI